MNINMPTLVAAVAASSATSAIVAAGFVNLQDSTPDAAQTGHTNISGYSLAGRFGAGVSPTLARVQVKETGGLQGVRAESGTGVAVFGKSTAGTGLGAGGYFTTSSIGGRGIVGDALSGTGNTVGGLFYNRSAGGGVGVWGRAIGAGGTATGVFGETLSANGTALAATNSGSGNSMTAGTSADSLQTVGDLPRHDYGTTTAAMVPVAYGYLAGATGGPFHIGSGNWTGTKPATGTYDIDISGVSLNAGAFVVVAMTFDSSAQELVTQASPASGDVRLVVRDLGSNALEDSDLQFVVYRTSNVIAGPPPAGEPGRPKQLDRYGDYETWQKRDPKGFEAWRRQYVAWQREQMRSQPYEAPTDPNGEGHP